MSEDERQYTICFQTDEETYWFAKRWASEAKMKLSDFYDQVFKIGMLKYEKGHKKSKKKDVKGDEKHE